MFHICLVLFHLRTFFCVLLYRPVLEVSQVFLHRVSVCLALTPILRDFPAVLIHFLCLWLSVIHFPGRIFIFIIFSNYNNKSWLITPWSSQREAGHTKLETALNLSMPSVLTTRICKLLHFHYFWTSAAVKWRLNWQKLGNTERKIKNVAISYDSHYHSVPLLWF